jgi:hypothetical protein
MRDDFIIVYTPIIYSFTGLNTRQRLSYRARELTNCKEERGIYDNILLKVGNSKGVTYVG